MARTVIAAAGTLMDKVGAASASPNGGVDIHGALLSLETLLASAGAGGPLLFIIIYTIAAVFLLPASALTLLAGFLFGPVKGTIVVSLGSTAGAAAAFLVGRTIARPWAIAQTENRPRLKALLQAVSAEGGRVVFLLRLSPLFPYSLINYALSLTDVSFGEYVVASWLGMLPATVAFVALGGAGRSAAESAGQGIGLDTIITILGAIATFAVAILVGRAAAKTLERTALLSDNGEDQAK